MAQQVAILLLVFVVQHAQLMARQAAILLLVFVVHQLADFYTLDIDSKSSNAAIKVK